MLGLYTLYRGDNLYKSVFCYVKLRKMDKMAQKLEQKAHEIKIRFDDLILTSVDELEDMVRGCRAIIEYPNVLFLSKTQKYPDENEHWKNLRKKVRIYGIEGVKTVEREGYEFAVYYIDKGKNTEEIEHDDFYIDEHTEILPVQLINKYLSSRKQVSKN